ncbi:hypothetical protein HDU93_009291 [Gonapodya sp. JEL0774]|nr:hypothetical protein HDU93_009291 [Gonapodya sp. JEL0774]
MNPNTRQPQQPYITNPSQGFWSRVDAQRLSVQGGQQSNSPSSRVSGMYNPHLPQPPNVATYGIPHPKPILPTTSSYPSSSSSSSSASNPFPTPSGPSNQYGVANSHVPAGPLRRIRAPYDPTYSSSDEATASDADDPWDILDMYNDSPGSVGSSPARGEEPVEEQTSNQPVGVRKPAFTEKPLPMQPQEEPQVTQQEQPPHLPARTPRFTPRSSTTESSLAGSGALPVGRQLSSGAISNVMPAPRPLSVVSVAPRPLSIASSGGGLGILGSLGMFGLSGLGLATTATTGPNHPSPSSQQARPLSVASVGGVGALYTNLLRPVSTAGSVGLEADHRRLSRISTGEADGFAASKRQSRASMNGLRDIDSKRQSRASSAGSAESRAGSERERQAKDLSLAAGSEDDDERPPTPVSRPTSASSRGRDRALSFTGTDKSIVRDDASRSRSRSRDAGVLRPFSFLAVDNEAARDARLTLSLPPHNRDRSRSRSPELGIVTPSDRLAPSLVPLTPVAASVSSVALSVSQQSASQSQGGETGSMTLSVAASVGVTSVGQGGGATVVASPVLSAWSVGSGGEAAHGVERGREKESVQEDASGKRTKSKKRSASAKQTKSGGGSSGAGAAQLRKKGWMSTDGAGGSGANRRERSTGPPSKGHKRDNSRSSAAAASPQPIPVRRSSSQSRTAASSINGPGNRASMLLRPVSPAVSMADGQAPEPPLRRRSRKGEPPIGSLPVSQVGSGSHLAVHAPVRAGSMSSLTSSIAGGTSWESRRTPSPSPLPQQYPRPSSAAGLSRGPSAGSSFAGMYAALERAGAAAHVGVQPTSVTQYGQYGHRSPPTRPVDLRYTSYSATANMDGVRSPSRVGAGLDSLKSPTAATAALEGMRAPTMPGSQMETLRNLSTQDVPMGARFSFYNLLQQQQQQANAEYQHMSLPRNYESPSPPRLSYEVANRATQSAGPTGGSGWPSARSSADFRRSAIGTGPLGQTPRPGALTEATRPSTPSSTPADLAHIFSFAKGEADRRAERDAEVERERERWRAASQARPATSQAAYDFGGGQISKQQAGGAETLTMGQLSDLPQDSSFPTGSYSLSPVRNSMSAQRAAQSAPGTPDPSQVAGNGGVAGAEGKKRNPFARLLQLVGVRGRAKTMGSADLLAPVIARTPLPQGEENEPEAQVFSTRPMESLGRRATMNSVHASYPTYQSQQNQEPATGNRHTLQQRVMSDVFSAQMTVTAATLASDRETPPFPPGMRMAPPVMNTNPAPLSQVPAYLMDPTAETPRRSMDSDTSDASKWSFHAEEVNTKRYSMVLPPSAERDQDEEEAPREPVRELMRMDSAGASELGNADEEQFEPLNDEVPVARPRSRAGQALKNAWKRVSMMI